ncbi:hypothetical protein MSPP1_003998 [Malassezia sp. CBS 17886]|nr:hypothetical protein MSPP1_003998 [Malassezia sp. CBS 17886]
MSATYAIYTSPNHAPVAYHLPTLIVTPYGQPQQILYSYVHTNYNKESYLLTPCVCAMRAADSSSMMGDLCVAKLVPPPGARRLGGPGPPTSPASDRSVYCEASRNLKWTVSNMGINAPVYKLTLPNPDMPGNDQPLFQISKPNPNAMWWSMFYFTYGGHLIPPKRIEFGRIQKNAVAGNGGGAGTRVTISGRTPEEKAVWLTLGEGNEDMVEWIVLCAALNLIDEEIVKAAARNAEMHAAAPQANGRASMPPSGIAPSHSVRMPQRMPPTASRQPQMPPSARAPPPGPEPPNTAKKQVPPRKQGGALRLLHLKGRH